VPDLDAVLSEHLRAVSAPEELGERLRLSQEPQRGPSRHPGARLAWAVAAVLVAGSAIGLHMSMKSSAAGNPVQASRFQAWVKAGTGLNLHAACRLCHDGEEQFTAFN
jgi:hypothetical protein